MPNKFCTNCGTTITENALFCKNCGTKIGNSEKDKINGTSTGISEETRVSEEMQGPISEKSALVALLLCLFLGGLGIHRFYVGKIGTGILMLLTAGGFGIWVIIDLILIATCEFKDKQSKRLVFKRLKGSPVPIILGVLGAFFAAMIVYGLIIFSLILSQVNAGVSVIDKQLTAIKKGDMQDAYSYTSTEFRKNTSYEDFKLFIDQYPIMKTFKETRFSNKEIENDKGIVRGAFIAPSGENVPVEYYLIKENNEWKIYGIRLHQNVRNESLTYSKAYFKYLSLPVSITATVHALPKNAHPI